ncbi:MAG: 2-hydroxychromene-2-carboxylate isomerase [Myxococcota bacterium]
MRYYFDFLSPYAYLAWHDLKPLALELDRTIEPKPILLAGLLNHWEQRGPAEIAPKRRFVYKDVIRRAAERGLPLEGPASHPFRPLSALRVSLPEVSGAEQVRVIDALFAASWGSGGEIGTDQGVATALNNVGLDGAALVAKASTPEVKNALRLATERALDEGVFGVPTVIVDGELVFGHDRLKDVRAVVEGRDTVDDQKLDAMLARPASAQRVR